MPRLTLLTFCTPEFEGSAEVLRHSAVSVGGCDAAVVLRPRDVDDHLRAIFPGRPVPPTGYGCWAWKPKVISDALNLMADGDWAVWVDAGVVVKGNLKKESCAAARRNGTDWLLAAPVPAETVADMTLPSCLALLGFTATEQLNALMVDGSMHFWRACPESRAFAGAWLELCSDQNLVEGPRESHRHDQSLLSIMAHQRGLPLRRKGWSQFGRPAPLALVHHHRLPLPAVPRVAVVTSSTGADCLDDCLESVQRQTAPGVSHIVFADGPQHWKAVERAAQKYNGKNPVHVVKLPFKTGNGGWNGHRAYAASSWLLGDEFDWVAYLDEDNVFAADHVQGLLEALFRAPGSRWTHSWRTVFDGCGGTANDDCESLGLVPNACGDVLVDTSCMLLDVALARSLSESWNAPARPPPPALEADRALTRRLVHEPHAVSRRYSVFYKTGNRPDSVRLDFFERGNAALGRRRDRPDLYVFHFGREATAGALALARAGRPPELEECLGEWNPSLLWEVGKRYNLIDGFKALSVSVVPRGAAVLVSLCHPEEAPLALLATRPDLRRVVFTAESPNIRHTRQWELTFLKKHFDVALTYYLPLLESAELATEFVPHNTHHLPSERVDAIVETVMQRAGKGTGVGCVLENRPLMPVGYSIDGVQLKCLDFMRARLVNALASATVCGLGWDKPGAVHTNVKIAATQHRSADPLSSVARLQEFAVSLISENTTAQGYVSEKIWDSILAGCVPAWLGTDRMPASTEALLDGFFVDLRGVRLSELGSMLQAQAPLVAERMATQRDRLRDMFSAVGCTAFADALDRALARPSHAF